jgi:hypothetical protein
MKQRTKENLLNIFGSLISNQRAINGAKHNPWWVAIIMFVLAVILPVVPITVNTSQTYGSQFLANKTNSWETQITTASLELHKEGFEFEVIENNKVKVTKNGNDWSHSSDTTDTIYNDTDALYTYVNSVTNEIDFQVYFSTKPTKKLTPSSQTIQTLLEELMAKRYETGTSTEQGDIPSTTADESEVTKTYYRPSFILIYTEGFYNYLSKPRSIEAEGSGAGDWKNTPAGTKLLERVLTVEGFETLPENASNVEFVNAVNNNWKEVFNEGYIHSRNYATLTSSLIFLGVYAGLSFFMGLMIFLLTRGKKNTFNYLTFWTCFKINSWASVAPGILALVLGFMVPSYAMMFFIILHGLRTMWLTTKQLRPQY